MRTDEIETIRPTKKLSLGFLGVGWIGRNRMDVLLESQKADATVVFEPDAHNRQAALASAPRALAAQNEHDVFNNPEIDGVVIATPSAVHAHQCLSALESGKAVFCRKPLARTTAEVSRIVAASKSSDKLLAVDLSYRFTKAFGCISEVVRNGSIGKIYAVNLVFHNAYGPDKDWFYDISKSGGGCVSTSAFTLSTLRCMCWVSPMWIALKATCSTKAVRWFRAKPWSRTTQRRRW